MVSNAASARLFRKVIFVPPLQLDLPRITFNFLLAIALTVPWARDRERLATGGLNPKGLSEKGFRCEYFLCAFCCLPMTTYSQTVIFGHLIHRISFAVTNVADVEVARH